MDTIWITATILITVWLTGVTVAALIDGPQPRLVRLGRDGMAVALPIFGLMAYLLIRDLRLSPLSAAVALVFGIGVGYFTAWRRGSVPAFGLAVVWGSPWQMALLALSGVVTSIGALGGWDTVVTAGLLVLCAAVGFGVGAYGYGALATADARAAIAEELNPVLTCPVCGADVRAGTRLCTQCGEALPKHCSLCGSRIDPAGTTCDSCGASVEARLEDAPEDVIPVRYCYACFIRIPMNAAFCPACGSLQPPACSFCGAPAMLDHETCPLCDIELADAEAAVESGLIELIMAEVEAEYADQQMAGSIPAREPSVGAQPASPGRTGGQPEYPPPPVPQPGFPRVKFCSSCGTEAQSGAAFCVRCGSKLG